MLPAKYNQLFVNHVKQHSQAYNDAKDKYGVTVTRVADPSKPHWRVIGIHHLDNLEGGGNNVYIDILDENGQRIQGARTESENANGAKVPVQIHKVLPDPGADFIVFGQDTLTIYVTQDGWPSDQVHNLHIRHADEGGRVTFAHHAFYVVFQRSKGYAASKPKDPLPQADKTLIYWDHHITGFLGNRSQYWEAYLKDKVPGLDWLTFKDEIVNQNPILKQDGWVFKREKVYKIPRGKGQPAAPATQPLDLADPSIKKSPPPEFVKVVDGKFQVKGKPMRFIGANIRGLVHYGQDQHYFRHVPIQHREIQLQAAREMNARLVRVFLAHKDATPTEVARRLRETLALMKQKFPEMYLLPALTNLYEDVPFYVKGDLEFYKKPARTPPNHKKILDVTFYKDGYQKNYLPFVEHIVKTFKDEPQIFAWEIGNELKVHNNPQLLVKFMTSVAVQIKSWDPNHLVTTGMISTRHAFMDKRSKLRDDLYGSPNIDFITIHPYNGNERTPEIEDDMDLAIKHNKPLIVEEAGFDRTFYFDRPQKMRADMASWFSRGASCYMPWGFVKTPTDNGDGDLNIGMVGPKHGDFDKLYRLHKQCGEILLKTRIDEDIRLAIVGIDL